MRRQMVPMHLLRRLGCVIALESGLAKGLTLAGEYLALLRRLEGQR